MKKSFIFLALIFLLGVTSCGTIIEETPETTTTVIVESRPSWSRYYYFDWESGRYIYGRRHHVHPPIYYHHPTPPPPPKKPHGRDVRPAKPGNHNPGGIRPGGQGGNRNPNVRTRPNNRGGNNHGTRGGSSGGGGRRR